MTRKTKLRKMGRRTTIDESKLKRLLDPKLVFALSHAVRAHVLVVLNEGVSSPSAVGKEIGVSAAYINYHFEELEREGLIELVRVEPRRGAKEHFYRAKETLRFDDGEWGRLHLSWTSTPLDARGFADVSELLQRTLEDVKAVEAESAERLALSGEEPIPTTVAMIGFEAAAGSPFSEDEASEQA